MQRVVVVLGLLAALLLGVLPSAASLPAATPAAAEQPVVVDRRVTDTVGALDGEVDRVRAELDALRAETGGSLYVVFVDTFEGAGGNGWAESVASRSGLTGSYLLLAVAVDTNEYEYWVGEGFPRQPPEVGELVTAAAEPQVVAGDWAGAVTALAEGLRTGEAPRGSADEPRGAWSTGTIAGVVAAVLGLLAAGHLLSRRSAARRGSAPAGG